MLDLIWNLKRSIVVAKCVFVNVLILCVIVSCSEGGDAPLETKIKIHNEKEWVRIARIA